MLLDISTHETKGTGCLEMSGYDYPMTQRHISEERKPPYCTRSYQTKTEQHVYARSDQHYC